MILFLFKNLSFHYTIFPYFLLSLSYLYSSKISSNLFKSRQLYLQPQNSVLSNLRLAS
ncbi:UDP pyrophosphate phosphatase [Streptococcus pseudopneumoniae]|nr:UDP pyrophosphate phosphatase [Streptococcus pseudopneumoniae]NIB71502.1 UDP pyrophosphate phosphatase [Streptococcus pseudopneumoniae]NIB73594.1 UDP pyrophosphate phosphatase [Streptococcus pseudopneumoniae]NIB80730.1 UDP pyrophosphate phosphatase [Streptococcus pseudopneumoniae]NIB85586.1 UDP pyrophosphate phosphatase [Streptococcus pseudopneumoniae]